MRRFLFLMLLPLALAVGCSHEAEAPTESALYRQYAVQKELKVAQVSGFKLCDTVRTDVVLLQADNEQAWQRLAAEFDIRDGEGSTSWLGEPSNPAQRTLWTGKPVLRVIASPAKRTIGFYQIDNEAQYDALLDYQLTNLKTKN